jgi:GNAT superfamily N-acetyltransferase
VLAAKVAGELGTRRVILYESTSASLRPLAGPPPGVSLDALRVGDEASYLDLDPRADARAVRRRLEAGERCFVARAGSRTVAAAWVSLRTGHVDHARVVIDLRPGEAYLHGVATAADWRRRGFGKAVFQAAQAALWKEGFRRAYSVAVPEHPASVALNAACADPVAVLTRRRIGSWIQVRVRRLHASPLDWDAAAGRSLDRCYLDPSMAEVKRRAHLDLLRRWLPEPVARRLAQDGPLGGGSRRR